MRALSVEDLKLRFPTVSVVDGVPDWVGPKTIELRPTYDIDEEVFEIANLVQSKCWKGLDRTSRTDALPLTPVEDINLEDLL